MSNRNGYTEEEIQGKFIVCSTVLAGRCEALEVVRYVSGERSGKPVLYDSIESAMEDQGFDQAFDEVIPASLYFERKEAEKNQIVKPNKSVLQNCISLRNGEAEHHIKNTNTDDL